jgi:hypothetical protein
MIIAIKSVEVVLGPTYDYLDGRWLGHSLRMPEDERIAFRKACKEKADSWKGWLVNKKVFWLVIFQLTAMVIVSWVVSVDGPMVWCDCADCFQVYIVFTIPG